MFLVIGFIYLRKSNLYKMNVGQKYTKGLPFTPRNIPELEAKLDKNVVSTFKELQIPGPNRFFTPIEDNRDRIAEQIKKEQEYLLKSRFHNIARR